MSFHVQLEDASGAILLESGLGYILLESVGGQGRVQAVVAGFYKGDYRDIGDVFDITDPADFSDFTVSQVPAGNPDYPIYGWMLSVPSTTPLVSWAASGSSSPRQSPRRTVE